MPLFGLIDELNTFLQYGSFGIVALLVFWAIAKFFPSALQVHKEALENMAKEHDEAVTRLIVAFEKEAAQCRAERMQVAHDAAEERHADRMARHELANAVQKLAGDR